jgi:hypothetical protein
MEYTSKKYFQDTEFAIQWVYQLFQHYLDGQATDKEKRIIENWDSQTTKYNVTNHCIESGCQVVWQKIAQEFDFNSVTKKEIHIRKRKKLNLYNHAKYVVCSTAVLFLNVEFYYYVNMFFQDEEHSSLWF